jgi:uncharacterized iron-regulated membrane protein
MSERPAWPKVPAAFVRENLSGHKLLGLALCAVLYLVSLSGTATVFFVEMERWEGASLPTVAAASPRVLAAALEDARAASPKVVESLAIVPPTPDQPRLSVGVGEAVRVYDRDGRYVGSGDHPVTHGLTALHYALSLPSAVGLPVVGLTGLGLVALLVGGLASHPRIFRDAFLWRWRSAPRLSRADLHNRIGVWAAPFHLAIALTGAVIGISSLVLLAVSVAFHDGDAAKAAAPLMGPAPAQGAYGRVTPDALVSALATLERLQPGARPSYIAVNQPGTDRESLSITAEVPDRLVYGETYEFDGRGRFAGAHGTSDGPAGKQVYASLYNLHFGAYGGLLLKWVYVLLGAGLCLACTSGLELWLIKSEQQGRPHPRLRRLWTGFVWAAPAAMALAALATLAWSAPFAAVFWSILAGGSAGALALRDHRRAARIGQWLTGGALLSVVAAHAARFGEAAASAAASGVNLSLAVIGVGLCVWAERKTPSPRAGRGFSGS